MDFLQSYHLNHHHKNIQKHLYNYTFALLNELKFIMDSSAPLEGGTTYVEKLLDCVSIPSPLEGEGRIS